MIIKRRKRGIESKKSFYGFMFVLIWIIGFLFFFFIPIIQSVIFSFSKVSVTINGFSTKFIGLENFRYIIYESAKYVDNLLISISSFVYKIPIVFILSLIIAVILNPKFKGRTILRSIFFIPVIISTGVVLEFINGDSVMEGMRSATQNTDSVYLSGLIDFNKVFAEMGLPETATSLITGYANEIFNLIWNCGIQIVLFIAGLQSIPDQMYEVSRVEGATKWEEFWYITVPMLSNTMVLVLVYTAIDFCTNIDNPVITQAYTVLLQQQTYDVSAAMLWIYFAIVGSLLGIVFLIINKSILRRWQ